MLYYGVWTILHNFVLTKYYNFLFSLRLSNDGELGNTKLGTSHLGGVRSNGSEEAGPVHSQSLFLVNAYKPELSKAFGRQH